MMRLGIVILAAGQGTRMRSALPKVIHPLAGKPLLGHVADCARSLAPARLAVVYGHGGDQVRASVDATAIDWVHQTEQLGTGHAVQQALPLMGGVDRLLVLYGDVPLITPSDVRTLLADHSRLTLAPDSEGDGTNCIVSSPPNLIRYRFDGHSFKPHVEAAYGIGITPCIVRNENLGIDVDTPKDLLRVLERAAPSHTRTCLETSGIATRLTHPHNTSSAM